MSIRFKKLRSTPTEGSSEGIPPGSSSSPIRILLVDDHTLFRRSLATFLRAESEYEVVGEAANGIEAIEKARDLMPDVILMDVSMPGINGLDAMRQILEFLPSARIVMLTASEDEDAHLEAVRIGAQGCLQKAIEPEVLLETIRIVARGEAALSRRLSVKLMEAFRGQTQGRTAPETHAPAPTDREKEILVLVSQGKSNKEIAAALGVAEGTVKRHMTNICEKLQLENRVQAASYAIRKGLTRKPPQKQD